MHRRSAVCSLGQLASWHRARHIQGTCRQTHTLEAPACPAGKCSPASTITKCPMAPRMPHGTAHAAPWWLFTLIPWTAYTHAPYLVHTRPHAHNPMSQTPPAYVSHAPGPMPIIQCPTPYTASLRECVHLTELGPCGCRLHGWGWEQHEGGPALVNGRSDVNGVQEHHVVWHAGAVAMNAAMNDA